MNDLPPLPVAVPFCAAAFLMAASSLLSRRVRDVIAICTSFFISIVCGLLLYRSLDGPIVYWFGGWEPRHGVALGICFTIDTLGAGLALLVSILMTSALIFSWRYFKEIGSLYLALMLTFLAAMCGFCLTGDLFNLFVFFELMSVSAYALTGYKIEEEAALMGAFNFAITNSVGAFLVLFGIGLLYGRTGALNLAQLGQAVAAHPADGLAIIALTLITCGFGVKAALVPFQFWLSDAHAVAPTPVCTLFSGVMVELGLFAVARVYWTVFSETFAQHAHSLRDIWLGLGALTALVGACMCFAERHLKRLLAFSTISHTGLFLIGFALLDVRGLAGTSLYVVGHGLVKSALFLAAGILLNRYGSVDENELRGRGKRFPALGVLFLVGGLALSGLPPFGTWSGKSLIEEAAGQLGYGWLSGILFVSSALTGAAVIRAGVHIFLGVGPPQQVDAETPSHENKETDENYDHPPAVMFCPPLFLLVLALLAGVWPGLDRGVEQGARSFEDQRAYARAVLDGQKPPVAEVYAETHWRLSGILWGVGSTAGAVLLGLVALNPRFVPQRVWWAANLVWKPGMRILRYIHSGQAADYVAWVTFGTSVFGVLGAWLLRG